MAFSVCAPGKVILFGEHAVVHGVPAIAASVALHTYLTVEPVSPASTIELDFPDVNLRVSWDLTDFTGAPESSGDVLSTLDPEVFKWALKLTDAAVPEDKVFAKSASIAFLYLFMAIARPHVREGYRFVVLSALPIGAGLGSSASLSVCLAAGLLHIAGLLSTSTQSETALDLVTKWSFLGECCIHGKPSGIDNVVATRGGAVHFQRQPQGLPPLIRTYSNFPELQLILTDTMIPRQTSELVARVHATKERWPLVFAPIMAAVTEIVREADLLLSSEHPDPEFVAKISDLIELNHGLLVALSVSHPTLEKVRETGTLLGLGNTKLTGAGGGGCAITIASPTGPDQSIDLFREKLGPQFKVFETKLGGQGVGLAQGKASGIEQLSKLPWKFWGHAA